MNETYIISDYSDLINNVIKELNITEEQIISFEQNNENHEIHDWITQIFKDNKIDKLIIPVSLPITEAINTVGIKLALHIRLNYELKICQRSIPIIFLSDFNIETILSDFNFDNEYNSHDLLFTKGVRLSSFDLEEINNTLNKIESCSKEEYHTHILNKLNIHKEVNIGNHSIANAWGCVKLAQVTGLRDEIFNNEAISKQLKSLYVKYLICNNDIDLHNNAPKKDFIECTGKKILFIDDQADEGWSVLMKNIFKSAGEGFISVDSSKYKNKETKLFFNYNGFKDECCTHIGKDWDLIIIDLRLYPEKEDIDNETIRPTEFSGYNLIEQFLDENKGNQIIVFTASNKVWNISFALNRGASSFYIKESPEYNYKFKETKEQFKKFKDDVNKCFKKKYLRDIYKEIKLLKLDLELLKSNLKLSNHDEKFIDVIINQLDISYSLLHSANSEEQFAYSYVSLCLIIEIIINNFVKSENNKWRISDSEILLDWKWTNEKYLNTKTEVKETIPNYQKFAGIYFQKWKKSDTKFVKIIQDLIQERNYFIHKNKKFNLDKSEIGKPDGFVKLFNYIKEIISYL